MTEQPNNFVSVVREYCAWAEGSALTPEEEAKKALSLLAALYTNVLALPKNGCGEDVETNEVTNEKWQVIVKRFTSLPFKYYSVSFSPANVEETPVTGDVADDLADIYRDIKNSLWLYDNGHSTEAIWEWKQSFNTHWGRHVVGALHALHCYMTDEYIEL